MTDVEFIIGTATIVVSILIVIIIALAFIASGKSDEIKNLRESRNEFKVERDKLAFERLGLVRENAELRIDNRAKQQTINDYKREILQNTQFHENDIKWMEERERAKLSKNCFNCRWNDNRESKLCPCWYCQTKDGITLWEPSGNMEGVTHGKK